MHLITLTQSCDYFQVRLCIRMQTGHVPDGKSGLDVALRIAELPLRVTLDLLDDETIGGLLTQLSMLHSDERCSCAAQHNAIDLSNRAVKSLVSGALNGGHNHVDLRKCSFWLPGTGDKRDLRQQNRDAKLPDEVSDEDASDEHATDEPAIQVIARAGNRVSTWAGGAS